MRPGDWKEWIQLVGVLILATASLCAFAFGTFETKEHSKEVKEDVVKRLDQIQSDVTTILNRGR